jgi:hypothetical protein
MRLEGSQRRQMHQALMSAFRNLETLKQELNFIDIRLGDITTSQNFREAVFEIIDWAEAQGQLPKVIDAAYTYNQGNDELREFVEDVWKPLQAEERQSNDSHAIPNPSVHTPNQGTEIIDLQTKRSRKARGGKSKASPVHKEPEILFLPPQPLQINNVLRQKKQSAKAFLQSWHTQVEGASNAIQSIIEVLRPDKDVYSDQCQFAGLKLQEADDAVENISTELASVPSTHAPSRYRLSSEQDYFHKEAREVGMLLRQFSNQTGSIPQRKVIFDKLQRLMKSLQEIDHFIEDFGTHV